MKALVFLTLMGCVAVGCGDKKSDAPASSASSEKSDHEKKKADAPTASATSAAAPTLATSASVAVTGPLPAEEDFEDKAEKQITSANAPDELAKLEKEIGK